MVFAHRELPREPILVQEPTVLLRPWPWLIRHEYLAAFNEFVPGIVDLGFTIEDREERNGRIELEDRPGADRQEILPCERERHDIAITRRRVGDGRDRFHCRVLEQRRIECGGLLRLLIE